MSDSFRFDPEDPFGSRPDEKPPSGWQEGFWDEVQQRIRQGAPEDPQGSQDPHDPASRRPAAAGPVVAALILLAASLLGLLRWENREGAILPSPLDRATTHVRVSGSAQPAVAVEWVKTGGRDSSYVVMHSIDPDVAWVVLPGQPVMVKR